MSWTMIIGLAIFGGIIIVILLIIYDIIITPNNCSFKKFKNNIRSDIVNMIKVLESKNTNQNKLLNSISHLLSVLLQDHTHCKKFFCKQVIKCMEDGINGIKSEREEVLSKNAFKEIINRIEAKDISDDEISKLKKILKKQGIKIQDLWGDFGVLDGELSNYLTFLYV